MSLSNNFPTIAPSLNLDFANVKALDPRITFVRTTTATYYGTETAKAEENLLTFSQELDQIGTWPPTNATVTANTEVAPNGTTTAETLTDNATSGAHICSQIITIPANTSFTFSCFLKEGTNTHAYLTIRDAAVAQRYFAADFNLDTGTVRTTDAGTSGTLTSSSITSVGNDWYRCVITGQVSAVGATTMRAVIGVSDGTTAFSVFGAISYVGTGTTIFAWGAQLEQRSAVTNYTPTTTQPITNFVPVLEVAAAGEARFDHNPLTFESLGLLPEEQRTNLILRSEDFSTTWINNRSSEQTNVIVSPAGTLTGDKIIANTDNDSHIISQTVSGTTNTNPHTLSVYIKAGEYFSVLLRMVEGSPFTRATQVVFNASSGAFSSLLDSGGASASSASITAVGNGWYRCSLTTTLGGSATSIINQVFLVSGGLTAFAGNDFDGIFIWGAQLEVGAFPTSYIPTVAATVTRNADVASMTGTNFSSWYRADEGSLYAEATPMIAPSVSVSGAIVSASDGTNNNRIQLGFGTASGGNANLLVSSSGSLQANPFAGSLSTNATRKVSGAYLINSFQVAVGGLLGVEDTSGSIPVVSQLNIGTTGNPNAFLNGHIKKIAFYPARLSNAQLQALTTV